MKVTPGFFKGQPYLCLGFLGKFSIELVSLG